MLTLHSLSGTTVELPYIPAYQAWEYLRYVIAPAAGFRVVNDNTVQERVMGKGVTFNFENRLRPIGDFLADGDKLYYTLPLGPSFGTITGNASPAGGGNMGCPICMEDTFDYALVDCLHRGHTECLKNVRDLKCPLCRTPFTGRDLRVLFPFTLPTDVPRGFVAVNANGVRTMGEATPEFDATAAWNSLW
jgi:hypothetical protein